MRTAWIAVFTVSLVFAGCDDDPSRGSSGGDSAADGDDESGTDGGSDDGASDDGDAGPGDPPDPPPTGGDDNGDGDGGDTDPSGNDDNGDDSDDDRGDDDSGDPVDECMGDVAEMVPAGWAMASSTFSGWFSSYPAELAIDGDLATSWFSEGIAVDGDTSTFEWITQFNHCIDHLTLYGNGEHEDEDFRENFGYESVRVLIKDSSGDTVYDEVVSLAGTPDPTIDLDPDGVLGNQVILEFSGHEDPGCGGFSELSVLGRPTVE